MDTTKFSEFFTQLFSELNSEDSIIVLILLGVAALLGMLLGWLFRGGRIRRLKDEVAAERQKYQLLHAEHAGLEERLQQLDKELADRDTRLENQAKDLAKLRKDVVAANGQINTLNIEKRRLSSQVSSASLDLENKLAAFETQQSQQETQLSARMEQINSMQEELNRIRAEKAQLEGELERLMDGNNAVVTPSSATIQNAFSQIKALDNRMRQMENENRVLQNSVLEVKTESDEKVAYNDISGLRSQLNIMLEENKDLKKQINNLQTGNTAGISVTELSEIKSRIAQLETENDNLKEQLEGYATVKNSDAFDFVDLETGKDPEVYDELVIERAVNAPADMADNIDQQQLALLDERERAQLRVMGDRIDVSATKNETSVVDQPRSLDASSADDQVVEKTASINNQNVNNYEKDELTKIDGIGPFIEKKLNEIGIVSFKQISEMDDDAIERITKAIEFFPGRIKRDDWVGQAKELLGG